MIRTFIAFLALLVAPALALASPIVYTPAPIDTIQGMLASYNATLNANLAPLASLQTATGSAGASTLNGTRGIITTETLATALSTSFTETLTNSSIQANSIILCQAALGTATTGVPVCASVVPAAGSATIIVRNVSTTAALNGTITLSFLVFN